MTTILVVLAGLAAGGAHVLGGADHVAAVAPLSATSRGHGWRVGARWGLGHALGILALGIPLLGLRGLAGLDLVSRHGERLVGVTLLAIGLWTVRRALSSHLHVHVHEHDGMRHSHLHLHARRPHRRRGDRPHNPRRGARAESGLARQSRDPVPSHSHGHAALGIGLLHGVAGSSHLFGLLPALALPTALASGVYLGSFAAGSWLAMVLFASLAGLVGQRLAHAGAGAHALLLVALGTVTGVVGAWWLVR